jgi:hypothetical protein
LRNGLRRPVRVELKKIVPPLQGSRIGLGPARMRVGDRPVPLPQLNDTVSRLEERLNPGPGSLKGGTSRRVQHRVVGLASRIFNGGKNIFPFQEGVISENFFEGSAARQEFQDVGNAETESPNAGAASALSFLHGYPLQPFDAHKLEVYDGLHQRARKSPSGGGEELASVGPFI